MSDRFTEIHIRPDGGFEGLDSKYFSDTPVRFSASLPLFMIREAWSQGVDFEDLADGFGPGMGTMGGDWSGIRDSSGPAKDRMFERALNHFFPNGRG